MSGSLSGEILARDWSLSFADINFVNAKPVAARLGLAVQLKFFSSCGFFADMSASLPEDAVSYVAEQLDVGAEFSAYDFSGRSGRRH